MVIDHNSEIRMVMFDSDNRDSMSGESLQRAGNRLASASETVDNAVIGERLEMLSDRCRCLADRDPDADQLAQLETTIRSASRSLDGEVAITVRRAGQDIVVYRDQRE